MVKYIELVLSKDFISGIKEAKGLSKKAIDIGLMEPVVETIPRF